LHLKLPVLVTTLNCFKKLTLAQFETYDVRTTWDIVK